MITKSGFLAVAGLALGLIMVTDTSRGAEITFSPQTGSNGAPFLIDTEQGFTTTPVSGTWLQGQGYGNPLPSIFDGPQGSPGIAAIQVVSNAPFDFVSVDYSSNNGTSEFQIQGFQGTSLQFSETGSLSASVAPFGFSTVTSANSSLSIDRLVIEITPGAEVGSINLDNISVASSQVPEPSVLGFLLLGALSLLFVFRRAVRPLGR